MTHLLVPTDFSSTARHALDAAVQLARPLAGSVTLLHAVELPDVEASPSPTEALPGVFVMKLLQTAKQRCQLLLREAAQHTAEASIRELLLVAPRQVAIQSALMPAPDMVVVGTTGTRTALGPTAEWLVRTAPCPVLLVRHPLIDCQIRVAVFPTDFSLPALQTGPMLHRMRAFFPTAALYVLHVSTPGKPSQGLATRLNELVQQLGLAGCRPAVVAAPSLGLGIAQFVQQVRAELVVLRVGSSGAGWLWPAVAAELTTPALPLVLTFRLADEA